MLIVGESPRGSRLNTSFGLFRHRVPGAASFRRQFTSGNDPCRRSEGFRSGGSFRAWAVLFALCLLSRSGVFVRLVVLVDKGEGK
jgi:hypothetical protein